MKRKHYPWLLGAVALTAGCAQAPIAKTDAEPAIKVAPVYRVQQPAGTAAGQYAVGRIDLAEGRVGAAIKRFQQALQLDSGFVEAHNGLGVAYGQQGRYAEAAAAFRAALALSPESPHVLNNLGFAQLKAGQLEDAAASLNRSLALDSGNERTRENLALLAAARTAVASALASAATPASPAADRGSSAAPAVAVPAAPVAPAVAAAAPAVAAPVVAAPVVAAPVATAPVATAPTAPAPTVAAPAAPAPRPALTIQPVAVPQVVSRPAFEVVVSRSNESALVQVAPNVYELRQGEAIAAASPAPAVASTQPAPVSVAATSAPIAAPAAPEIQAPVAAPAVAAAPVAQPIAAAPKPSTPEPLAVAPVVAQSLAPSPQPDVKPSQAKAAEAESSKAQHAQVIQPPPITQFSLAAAPLSPAKRPATTASLGGLDGLEVSNGVGIRHLAGRTARSLSRLGVTVARVSDYRLFGRQRTEIHYRSGHVEQAMAVRTSLPVGARLVRTDRLHPSVNVRLVIGKDLVQRQVAWLGEDVLTAEAEDAGTVVQSPVAAAKGLDLAPHAAKVARADVENGWRYL